MSATTLNGLAVPLNDFKRLWAAVSEEAHQAFEHFGQSGWYVLGQQVAQFEAKLATSWGLPHAVGVGNGLDAIEIALRALGLQPGDKVLTTPLSAFATTLAILRAGGIPVFVDVDASGQMDLQLAEAVLSAETIHFMVPVHLYGHALSLARLKELQQNYGLIIVEDCAQAIGAKSAGIPVGSVGDAAATSFYPTKNLGAFGDGGALLTADSQLAEAARALRDYGQCSRYVHDRLGMNSRLDELQATLLQAVILPKLDAWTERRRQIAEQYFSDIAHPAIQRPPIPENSQSVWHLFPVLIPSTQRADFIRHLQSQGVMSAIHYPRLIPEQPVFEGAANLQVYGSLENARRFAEQEVSLPIHPFLHDDEVSRVITACNTWSLS